MAIIKLVDEIVNADNNNEITAGVFMDLSKAFDTLNHDILLSKMNNYGFRGIVLEWFRNYLSNRKQYVVYNNHNSKIKSIDTGMPQGSILGPLGFIIYVNDIPNCVPDLSCILYADDTSVLASHQDLKTLNDVMSRGIQNLNEWFKSNKLSLNLKKTNSMLFGTQNKTNKTDDFKLSLDNIEIERVNTFKFLGVTVDQNLSWKTHIDNLRKKCCSSVGILYKVNKFLPESALLSLYHTLVLSHFSYGITGWSSASDSHKSKLHIMQKRALRAISNSNFRSHSNPLFINYNQLKVFDLCNLNIGSFMYNYCNNLLPSAFNNLFNTNDDYHTYNTRNASDFKYPKIRTELGRKSISYQGVKIWNDIPNHIKKSKNIGSFRHSYKNVLISQY